MEILFFIRARKMQVFLPDLMEVLQDGNEDLKMKALVVVGSRFSLLGADQL